MAGIDKTFCKRWTEYQEIVNWAENTTFICPNGIILYPINYIYEWEEESFNGEELPIMNTSQSLDYFLIKYCPFQLVQNRMREVYGDEYVESIKNGTSEYDKFVRPESGTKIKMLKESNYHNRKLFSIYNPYFNKKVIYSSIHITYQGDTIWYNKDYDIFLLPYELGYWTCSCADLFNKKSLKAIIRKIKKWKLPKGAIVEVRGRYIGEDWKFKIV